MLKSIDRYWETKKLPGYPDRLWELYHENSKNRKLGEFSVNHELVHTLHTKGSEGHQFIGKKRINLPKPGRLRMPIGEAISKRRSVRKFKNKLITLKNLSTILHAGYGIQYNDGGLRAMRSSPSAGRLFPLEIYLYARKVKHIQEGLYHYNPLVSKLEYVLPGDHSAKVSEIVLSDSIATDAACTLFITGVFERSTLKYEERGYRYTLFEAGHLAQNICLAATALNLGSLTIGGFFDSIANDYLEVDGIEEATLYMIALGYINTKS